MDITQPMNVPYPLKLRIEDFEVLEKSGAFDRYKKVELIDGEVVGMNAEYRPHTRVKSQLMHRLQNALEALGSRFEAVVEPTVALPPHNLPEPDVAVVCAPMERDYYRIDHVALVIEVSDSTIAGDLGRKQRMYAENLVPEYWVIDVVGGDVHQFSQPGATGYGQRRALRLGNRLTSVTMPELVIDSSGL